MSDESLPPVEIPWKLASTSQPLATGEPAQTSISLFTFEPDVATLPKELGDERLIYLKFTVSISPASLPASMPAMAGAVLGVGIPCFYVQLDLKVRSTKSDSGTIRPYFHAAAPLSRRMIQSGVVGAELYEGDSEGQFMGKSGSQMYESSKSHSTTQSTAASVSGGYLPYVSASVSFRQTSTDLSAERAVSQVVDTTTRQASEERRELVSHHTKVENVLTLLSTKYVGTPHLSFSLSPQPVQLLSLDPSDPNLWFSQLLQRRSSGIEGIQEFTAVVVVPRGEDFCVNARLRRVCVLDAPPPPLSFEDEFTFNQHTARVLRYLNRVYPPGTPIEDLDVDFGSAVPDTFTRPVIEVWYVSDFRIVRAWVVSPVQGNQARLAEVNYKPMSEVWLETVRDEYEREAARSPLERGVTVGDERFLDTCFAFGEGGGLVVSSSSTSVNPLFPVDFNPGDLAVGGVSTVATSARATARQRAFETATRWNVLETRAVTLLANGKTTTDQPMSVDDPRMMNLLIERWSTLPADDRRNLDFDAAIKALGLTEAQSRQLKSARATDLRSIARAIRNAPEVGRYNAQVPRLRKIQTDEKIGGAPPSRIAFPITPSAGAEMTRTIGAALQADFIRARNGT